MAFGQNQRSASKFDGAILGGALGDAMGWPFEDRARKSSSSPLESDPLLQNWTKRSGGRFQPHEERIPAGSYSDDTQLVIAVARARLTAHDWWLQLANVEFPFWQLYQRGGGGATLRAVRLLQKRTLPWEAGGADRQKYFSAGGNGVAMRIAPHSLLGAADDDFSNVAIDVLSDGVLTHGHPRALVGALLQAYALWYSLRKDDTLEYGELLSAVRHYQDDWSLLPNLKSRWPSWAEIASRTDYIEMWQSTVEEVLTSLDLVSSSFSRGALDYDEEVLHSVGAFDKQTNGSGTVAAISSLFLTSKYATAPMEGVVRAATARGMDTDTIASMCGSLLGSINGRDWLLAAGQGIQDSDFLGMLARRLFKRTPIDLPSRSKTRASASEFLRALKLGQTEVILPLGTRARVVGDGGVISRSSKLQANSWLLKDELGQTFTIKNLEKAKVSNDQKSEQSAFSLREDPDVQGQVAGVSLLTSNLKSARFFYVELLGISVTRETHDLVGLGRYLVLRASDVGRNVGEGTILYVEVTDIQACRDRLKGMPSARVSPIRERSGRATLTCFDPDGRTIEILQKGS